MRHCPHCAQDKSDLDFHRDQAKRDGLASWCKPCTRARARRWQRENPERRRVISARWVRRNLVRHTYGSARGFMAEAREYIAVLRRDPCGYCGRPTEHVDHITPTFLGGSNEWDNLTAACASCNSSKRETPLLVWLATIGPIYDRCDHDATT